MMPGAKLFMSALGIPISPCPLSGCFFMYALSTSVGVGMLSASGSGVVVRRCGVCACCASVRKVVGLASCRVA
eukprot:10844997-Alexandrium_andersonii.AAC.1